MWCRANYLSQNTTYSSKLIMGFRKESADLAPFFINRYEVEWVHFFGFLGVQIVDDLSWSANTKAKLNKEDWWSLTVSALRALSRFNHLKHLTLVFLKVLSRWPTLALTVGISLCIIIIKHRSNNLCVPFLFFMNIQQWHLHSEGLQWVGA